MTDVFDDPFDDELDLDPFDDDFIDEDDLLDDLDDDEIDEDDALNYIEDLDDESDPFDDELDDEPLDKIYERMEKNPFRRRIVDEDSPEDDE